MIELHCPACGSPVEIEQYTGDATCPGCGTELEAFHNCCWDGEDEHCYDWLEVKKP